MNPHEVMNLMSGMSEGDAIIVDWLDACSMAGEWTEKEDFDPALEIESHAYVNSIGFLFKTLDKGVVIVQSISDSTISEAIFIPFGMIIEIRKLEDAHVAAKYNKV